MFHLIKYENTLFNFLYFNTIDNLFKITNIFLYLFIFNKNSFLIKFNNFYKILWYKKIVYNFIFNKNNFLVKFNNFFYTKLFFYNFNKTNLILNNFIIYDKKINIFKNNKNFITKKKNFHLLNNLIFFSNFLIFYRNFFSNSLIFSLFLSLYLNSFFKNFNLNKISVIFNFNVNNKIFLNLRNISSSGLVFLNSKLI